MKAQHTPGPWISNGYIYPSRESSVFDWCGSVTRAQGGVVFVHQSGARDHKEAEANMRLIAAAPEMLEVLENLLENGIASLSHEADVEMVIEKAKGPVSSI